MGYYVNPDNESLITSLNSKPYVDKSGLIGVLNENVNTNHANVCVSRPRRFGKSMAVDLAVAYYSRGCDSRNLFEKLYLSKTEGWDKYLNKFNVIQLDLIDYFSPTMSTADSLEKMRREVVEELCIEFEDVDIDTTMEITQAMKKIYLKTKTHFMVFIDEYDLPIREQAKLEELEPYLHFLNEMFKSRSMQNVIKLGYLTGILPPVADRVESKLNNFTQFSILSPKRMAPYFGFTSGEVKQLCEQYDLNYEECCRWYDGYKLFMNNEYTDIFNPQAVASAIRDGECNSYWPETASYEPISEQINRNADGIQEAIIKMLTKESVPVDVSGFLNSLDKIETRDEILTYLIHLGYLSYDAQNKTCTIPNLEIQKRLKYIVSRANRYNKVNEVLAQSAQLLEDTIALKSDKVAEGLRQAHASVGSILTYNNEATLQTAIYLAYFTAINHYSIFKEVPMGEGVADLLHIPFVPDKPAIIIELKVDQSTTVALNQIENKRYAQPLEGYHGNVLRVAVNYDRKSKKHECEIRKETI